MSEISSKDLPSLRLDHSSLLNVCVFNRRNYFQKSAYPKEGSKTEMTWWSLHIVLLFLLRRAGAGTGAGTVVGNNDNFVALVPAAAAPSFVDLVPRVRPCTTGQSAAPLLLPTTDAAAEHDPLDEDCVDKHTPAL